MKKMKWLFPIFLFILMFQPSMPKASTNQEEHIPEYKVYYQNDELGFSLKFPDGWRIAPEFFWYPISENEQYYVKNIFIKDYGFSELKVLHYPLNTDKYRETLRLIQDLKFYLEIEKDAEKILNPLETQLGMAVENYYLLNDQLTLQLSDSQRKIIIQFVLSENGIYTFQSKSLREYVDYSIDLLDIYESFSFGKETNALTLIESSTHNSDEYKKVEKEQIQEQDLSIAIWDFVKLNDQFIIFVTLLVIWSVAFLMFRKR